MTTSSRFLDSPILFGRLPPAADRRNDGPILLELGECLSEFLEFECCLACTGGSGLVAFSGLGEVSLKSGYYLFINTALRDKDRILFPDSLEYRKPRYFYNKKDLELALTAGDYVKVRIVDREKGQFSISETFLETMMDEFLEEGIPHKGMELIIDRRGADSGGDDADDLKRKRYGLVYRQIESLMEGEDDVIANMSNIAALLHVAFGFWWTGFYLVKGGVLVLGPFQGPVACSRIPFGRGVCGTAWLRRASIAVPDVDIENLEKIAKLMGDKMRF